MNARIITKSKLKELIGPMPVKEKINGCDVSKSDFRYDWQSFVLNRQNDLYEKINNNRGLSSEYSSCDSRLFELLEQAAGAETELLDELLGAAAEQRELYSYMTYNKGYLDGIKFALMTNDL